MAQVNVEMESLEGAARGARSLDLKGEKHGRIAQEGTSGELEQ